MAEPIVIKVRDLVVGFGAPDRARPSLSRRARRRNPRRGRRLGRRQIGAARAPSSGFCRSAQASIEVLGVDLDAANEAERRALERRWGVLFQQGALFSSLTVRENVQFPMRENLDISQRLMDEMALAKLEMVGLTPRRRRQISRRTFRRHDQARGACKSARARSGDRVPRRADLWPRPDLRRRFRRADPHAAAARWG